MGTLDPKVTGVLPITLGRACRLAPWFMHRDKKYVGILRLHKDIPTEKLKKEMKKFEGKIIQTPPLRSRVKRLPRQREVKSFKFLEKQGKDVLFEAEVEAGTYIRTLCVDLGKNIGGAHMLELRRTKAGLFSETDKEFVNLYEFEKAVKDYNEGNETELRKILIPAEILSESLPVIQINPESEKQLLTGKPIHKKDIKENLPSSEFFMAFLQDKFIGIYQIVNEDEILARPKFVFN